MNAMSNLLQSTCRAIRFGSEIVGYTVSFGRSLLTPKAVLAAQLVGADSQQHLGAADRARSTRPVPRHRCRGGCFRQGQHCRFQLVGIPNVLAARPEHLLAPRR